MEVACLRNHIHEWIDFCRFRVRLAGLLGIGHGQSIEAEAKKKNKTEEARDDGRGGATDKETHLPNGGAPQAAPEEDEDTEDKEDHK